MRPEVPEEALRLREELMSKGPALLRLDGETEWLESDDQRPWLVTIRTDQPRAPAIPLLDATVHPWFPRVDPARVFDMAESALDYLSFLRVWRHLGTDGPPAGLILTDRFTTAILDQAGVNHQTFVDVAWRPGELMGFGMRSDPWQDARARPKSISFRSSREPERIEFPDALPWIAGFAMPTHLVVTAAGFKDGITVGHTSHPDGRAVVTIPRDKGIAVVTAAGGDLRALVRNRVLRGFHLPVAGAEVLQRSLRYEVDWRDPGQDRFFDDDLEARDKLGSKEEELSAWSWDLPDRMAAAIGGADWAREQYQPTDDLERF
ncbi:hypothetical protein [Sphingomonas sp.]|uniref:hypothetical protein n=1 Tax=Sphingomonas sp. TaxID=28214 RepID=UPI0035BBF6C9